MTSNAFSAVTGPHTAARFMTPEEMIEEIIKPTVSKFDMTLNYLIDPGNNYIGDGKRGSGKTHLAVAVAEYLIRNPYGPWGKVVVLTNIIMLQHTEHGFVESMPEGMHHITSMKEMFRVIADVLREHGEDVRIVVILDEAQNFMLSDLNSDKVNLALIKLFGTARKLRSLFWLLSPTIKNFVPRVRNFFDDDNPGYMSGIFRKNPRMTEVLMKRHNLHGSPRDFTTIKYGFTGKTYVLPIPPSTWTRKKDVLDVGEYCYDHLASADFELGENFDMKALTKAISNISFDRIPDAIDDYLDSIDEDDGEEISVERIVIREKMETSVRLKEQFGLSGVKVAAAVGMSETTWRRHYDAYMKMRGREASA